MNGSHMMTIYIVNFTHRKMGGPITLDRLVEEKPKYIKIKIKGGKKTTESPKSYKFQYPQCNAILQSGTLGSVKKCNHKYHHYSLFLSPEGNNNIDTHQL